VKNKMMRAAAKMVRTLYGRITLGVVVVVLFTVLTNLLVVRHQVELTMRQARDDHARNFLQSTLANVEAQYRGLLFHQQTAMDLRKKEIRDVVEFALTVVRDFHARVERGAMTTATAQSMALDVLRSYRYDNGTGYVWVNNVDRPLPRVLMHPILPELDGVVVDEPQYYTAYGQHVHLFKAFVDLCLEQGAGYVDYLWPKPIQEGLSSLQKKVSFVRLFPEWGWVLGSGLYIDDIDAEAQRKIKGIVNDLNETLGPLTIGTAGYLFVFDDHDTILVHPSKVGQDLKGLVDPLTGTPLSHIFRKAAAAPDNSISYMWDKPGDEGHYVHMKRAHVFHFKPLDWYIATTIYEDEDREASNRLLRNLSLLGLLLLLVALLACLPLVRSLVRPMTLLSKAAEQIARQGLNAATIPLGGTEEVRQLGAVLAQMIFSIRLSQQQLRESEEKYRSMMEAMDDMIFICSSDYVIEYMNPSMIRFLGWDATHMGCRDALADCRGFCEGCDQPSSIHERVRFRLVHSGEDRHYHVTSCPVTHPDGTLSMMSIIRDVSDQTRAEARLRDAQKHIQNIINSMPSMVIGLDRVGLINLWNKESAQILGLEAEQVREKDMSVLPHCLAFLRGMFLSSMETGDVVKKNKLALTLGRAQAFWDVTVYPLDDDHGAVIRIDDVSELVRLEEIMIQSEKMLSVGGLAAGMAHEINNPLAGIVQNAQVIRLRLHEDLQANASAAEECGIQLEGVYCYLERRRILSMIDMIVDSGARAAKIVANMLSFVRKSGNLKRPEDLAQLMDKTVELVMNDYDLKKNYDFRQIEIIRVYAPNVPRVMCEASKIQQVFMNLLKNGAQAMAEVPDRASRFILRVGYEGEAVKVEVEDNGPGLSDSVRKRIFEPFFTTKPPGIGTGLGLSISYFIVVEHHGGVMRVETLPGQLTNFIMLFPSSQESGSEPLGENS
jgi:PAS domain S-box-containing protein